MRLEMLLFVAVLYILVLDVTPSHAIHVTRMHQHMGAGVNDNNKAATNNFELESIDQLAVNFMKDATLLAILRASGKTLCTLPTTADPKAPKVLVKLKTHVDNDKLLEIKSEGKVHVDGTISGSGSGSGAVQVWPAGAMSLVGLGGATAAAHRATIRGGVADAAAALGFAVGGHIYPPFSFLWTLDASGRVTATNYFMGGGFASNPGELAKEWCDVAWNHGGTNGWGPGTQGNGDTRVRSEYQTGHLVAASHGGENHEPLNFIPLHFQSNTNGGRWARIEAIATAVKGRAGPTPHCAGVDITIAYNDDAATVAALYPGGLPAWLLTRPFVPIGGTYTVSVSDVIMRDRFRPTGAALTALITAAWDTLVDPPLTAWCNTYFGIRSLEAVFCKRAQKVVGPAGTFNAGRWVLTTDWKNAADMAVPGPPGAGLGVLDATRYVPQPNLF